MCLQAFYGTEALSMLAHVMVVWQSVSKTGFSHGSTTQKWAATPQAENQGSKPLIKALNSGFKSHQ